MPASPNNLAVSAYAARQRDAGHTRINVVLSPDDMAAVGLLMVRLNVSRQEAIRRAVRIASEAA